MILNTYETIYIIKPDTGENNTSKTVHKYKFFLKRNGAQNIFIQHRGRRHLSYNIKNHYDGIYVQMNYDGNPQLIILLEKLLKFDDKTIRYLTMKQNTMVYGKKVSYNA